MSTSQPKIAQTSILVMVSLVLKSKLDKISKEKGNFNIGILPYNALMIIYTENSKNALYLICEYSEELENENKYEHMYRSSDFSSSISSGDKTNNGHKIRQIKGIPIPHYLFAEMSSGNYYANKDILIKGNINEFYEFYRTFQRYYSSYPMEIQKENNKIILKNIPVNIEIEDDKGAIQNELSQLKQVTLTFSQDSSNNSVVSISFIN